MHKYKQEKAFTKAREEDLVDPLFAELQFCDKFFGGKGCKEGRDCFFSHDRVMKAKAQMAKGICRQHFRDNSCRFGLACKFSHDAKWLSALQEENGDCRQFKRGDCRFGGACLYKHTIAKKFAHEYRHVYRKEMPVKPAYKAKACDFPTMDF